MTTTLRRSATRAAAFVAVILVCGLVMSHKGVLDGVAVSDGVLPVLAQAAVQGLLYALFAVGLVLVYRASRVINCRRDRIGWYHQSSPARQTMH
jgi:uncharacterized ion transporter superfamily protein YfcC